MDEKGSIAGDFLPFIRTECFGIGVGVDGNNRIYSIVCEKILHGDFSIELIHDGVFRKEKTNDAMGFCFYDNGSQVPVFIGFPPDDLAFEPHFPPAAGKCQHKQQ